MLPSWKNVLKPFWLLVFLTIFFTAFITRASFTLAKSSPQKTPSVEVINFKVDVPTCYMETAKGTVLNLSNLCKQPYTNSDTRSNLSSPRPYNSSLIKKFDDELYGKGN
ncbi:MAG: hypothetical protein CLLPBCKN_002751 [Chroococcidiopsis cubana SAG 39.79]|jgi:uncharacterized alpha/beta hydrolase family protein|nr:hypothetical protein [Chroococcidiopsis cubana SAG 39.79]